MPKKIINNNKSVAKANSCVELVDWPKLTKKNLYPRVVALQTTRLNLLTDKNCLTDRINEFSAIEKPHSHFSDFNLGLHVGDNQANVNSNRLRLSQYLTHKIHENKLNEEKLTAAELTAINIQWLNQVHGNKVVTVNDATSEVITADASITQQKHVALAIMTADCLPILLSHRHGDEVAAIHGGWRSLESGIIQSTLSKMHSKVTDVIAWLGPCIGREAFEVGAEVRAAFTRTDKQLAEGFTKQPNGKYLADLYFIATHQLRLLGVHNISSLPECTFQNEKKYYSYRRNATTGRMASIICRY